MSKRRRENMNRSNTKKEIAMIAASACIPVAGTIIMPVLMAKKAIPAVKKAVESRKK